MKFTNLVLLVFVSVFLVGCGAKNLPAVDKMIDIEPTEEMIDDAMEEDMEEDMDADADTEEKSLIDTLKERNNIDDEIEDTEDTSDENIIKEYMFDLEESSLNWKAGKIIPGGDHSGTVTIKSGSSVYVDSQLDTTIAVIDMTTITSDAGDGLDGHLKNEDFFDVENHPEATIEITSTQTITDSGSGDYVMATADLTIKDITNPITFPIYPEEYGYTANITIDRTLWDITYGSDKFFDDLKDNAIRDEIEFEVNIAYVL